MASFPIFLKKLQTGTTMSASTYDQPSFQVRLPSSTVQAKIHVTDQTIMFTVKQSYQFELATQLVPQFSEQGVLQEIGLEFGSDKLTIRHNQQIKLDALYEQLSRMLSHKGFNDYYKPLKRLGRGNFASVYMIEHKFTKKTYAAKVFGRTQQYLQMNGKEALENEISIMRSLQHKNILGIHSVHETENLVYLIVEHMDGGTLEDYMRSRLHLTGEEIVKIIKQILSALDYLDSKSIMHRDLKPSNIMQRKDTGDWVLTDFGLAARANTNYLYQKCGTPGFIAPEILRLEKPEQQYSQSCDIFSFGIIIYTMIVGRLPFQCKDEQEMYEVNKNCAIKFPEKEKEELHPDILEFIMRMLESNPSRRVTPKNALETSLLTKPEVSQSLIKYFQIQKERAMKKVLQFANNSNI